MKKIVIAFAVSLMVMAATAPAGEKTVTLDVPGMTCAACPLTIKAALNKVEGVEKAEVSFENKEAKVTFDDAKTTVAKLTEATKNAGYPSTVKRERR